MAKIKMVNDIPSAVLEMIFSCCSMSERLVKIESVCSYWLTVSKSIISSGGNGKQRNCGNEKLALTSPLRRDNIDLSNLKWLLNMKVFVSANVT